MGEGEGWKLIVVFVLTKTWVREVMGKGKRCMFVAGIGSGGVCGREGIGREKKVLASLGKGIVPVM